VSLGRGLTLVSEAATAVSFPGVIYRPLLGEELSFSAVWSPRNENPAFRRMLSLARKMSKAQPPPTLIGESTSVTQTVTIDPVALLQKRAVIDKWIGSGILLVVTHGANIRALTGISPASGEIVVVRSGSGGSSERVGRLILD
jgi:hypothetical protein